MGKFTYFQKGNKKKLVQIVLNEHTNKTPVNKKQKLDARYGCLTRKD